MGFHNTTRGVRPGDLDALAARVDTAQETAERKARVFVNDSTDEPAAEAAGDLWFVGDLAGMVMRRATAAGTGHWHDLWDFGSSVDATVTGGLGRAVFPHRLASTPTAIVPALRQSATARTYNLAGKDSTSFTVAFHDETGALVPDGTVVAVDYIAVD